jgi:hypothetical protein
LEGPAEEKMAGGLVGDVMVSVGLWPIGYSSSASLYHWKSADDAAIVEASECTQVIVDMEGNLHICFCFLCNSRGAN